MKSNFLQRAITGIIFVAVLIGCIVGGAVSFGILFAIISALAINEFCNLVNHVEGIQVNKRICILSGIFLFLCFFYFGIDPSQTGKKKRPSSPGILPCRDERPVCLTRYHSILRISSYAHQIRILRSYIFPRITVGSRLRLLF